MADLINGAPETADTLRELADLIDKNKDVTTALNEAIGKKANQTELDQAVSDISSLNRTLATHKTSGDHDSRYYTKDQVNEKNHLKVLKNDWATNVGVIRALYSPETDIIDFTADLNGRYPSIRATRASCDGDGNNIPATYLKKTDISTSLRQVVATEYNKYFGNTWSYAGPSGVSIDAGTWLVSYYAWFASNTGIPFISIKSTQDEMVGATAPTTSYGTFLEMHEIIAGKAIGSLAMLVYVPNSTTFGQFSSKIRAIKLC